MSETRKPRIQGKIAKLLPNQREQVHAWFRENLDYSQIAKNLQRQFGVKIAKSSLSNYYSLHSFEIFGSPAKTDGQGVKLVVHIEISPAPVSGGYEIKQFVNYPSESK